MQLDSVTELLGIANFKVAYMVRQNENRIDLVLRRIEEKPCVCSGCGKVHHTPIRSIDTVIIEDLPISGKRVFLHVPKRRSLCAPIRVGGKLRRLAGLSLCRMLHPNKQLSTKSSSENMVAR